MGIYIPIAALGFAGCFGDTGASDFKISKKADWSDFKADIARLSIKQRGIFARGRTNWWDSHPSSPFSMRRSPLFVYRTIEALFVNWLYKYFLPEPLISCPCLNRTHTLRYDRNISPKTDLEHIRLRGRVSLPFFFWKRLNARPGRNRKLHGGVGESNVRPNRFLPAYPGRRNEESRRSIPFPIYVVNPTEIWLKNLNSLKITID